MAPKRSTKKAAALAQPTISFQAQRKSSFHHGNKVGKAASAASVSTHSVEQDDPIVVDAEARLTRDAAVTPKEGTRKVSKAEKGGVGLVKDVTGHLDPRDKRWRQLYAEAEKEMGMSPIHTSPDTHNTIHHILRVFDMTTKYGPALGRTRLERWERAKKLGLNPPDEIRAILMTTEGKADASYRENVLFHYGI
ncbi:hypothetical protein Q5752_005694 [Cryptotrichosporon argae]